MIYFWSIILDLTQCTRPPIERSPIRYLFYFYLIFLLFLQATLHGIERDKVTNSENIFGCCALNCALNWLLCTSLAVAHLIGFCVLIVFVQSIDCCVPDRLNIGTGANASRLFCHITDFRALRRMRCIMDHQVHIVGYSLHFCGYSVHLIDNAQKPPTMHRAPPASTALSHLISALSLTQPASHPASQPAN